MRARFPLIRLAVLAAVWLGIAEVLSQFTQRIADWFVMTDELYYERLAISIDRLHTPFAHVHGESVSNINQLYPLLIAHGYAGGSILEGFRDAHVMNAFVMSSAAVPAYLLARRVTAHAWLPLVAAAATVLVPWMTLSSFLLTEVAAYPAFLWAVLGIQVAVVRPRIHNDLLAVAGIVLAVLARTQFVVLAAVLAVAVLGEAAAARRFRATVRAHVTLVVVYTAGAVLALGLAVTGHGLLGTYGETTHGNPVPLELVGAAPAHLAIVALAGGLLPFLLGGAWVVSNLRRSESPERSAFAWTAIGTVVVLTLEVASFDARFGGGLVRERYLFYVAPVLFVALAACLTASRLPRWSLAAPLVILAVGFWQAPLPSFQKLNVDMPAAVLNDWLLTTMHGANGARVFLIVGALVLAVAVLEAAMLVPRLALAIGVSALLLVALPAETGYAFKRLFAVDGTSGLPLTLDQSAVFGWVDRQITPNSEAVMIPYPVVRGDYWANVGFWWDLEFWNLSVDREASRPNQFAGTPATFPKIDLRFDPRSGKASFDVDSYVAQAVGDARFHVKGRFLHTERNVTITFPDRPWRADWVSYGLYADGWTRPARDARIRVFADPAQRSAVTRALTLTLLAPVQGRILSIRSNAGSWRATVGTTSAEQTVKVCVPPNAPADVTLHADGASRIEGDPSTAASNARRREGGVLVAQVSLAAATGATCEPSR